MYVRSPCIIHHTYHITDNHVAYAFPVLSHSQNLSAFGFQNTERWIESKPWFDIETFLDSFWVSRTSKMIQDFNYYWYDKMNLNSLELMSIAINPAFSFGSFLLLFWFNLQSASWDSTRFCRRGKLTFSGFLDRNVTCSATICTIISLFLSLYFLLLLSNSDSV